MTSTIPPGPIDHLFSAMLSLKRIKGRNERDFKTLTPREKEVLGMVAKGLPNPEIARALRLSRVTVQNHRASIRQKLNIASEADYIKLALAYDLIQL